MCALCRLACVASTLASDDEFASSVGDAGSGTFQNELGAIQIEPGEAAALSAIVWAIDAPLTLLVALLVPVAPAAATTRSAPSLSIAKLPAVDAASARSVSPAPGVAPAALLVAKSET